MNLKYYKIKMFITIIIVLTAIHGVIFGLIKQVNGAIPTVTVVSFICGIVFIYDKWLWRYIPFLLTVRDVSGRYEGTLESSFGGNSCCHVAIEIFQTASTIRVKQYSLNDKGQSYSKSDVAHLSMDEDGQLKLEFSYYNEGDQVRQELDGHNGYCILRFNRECSGIEGFYFTNRSIQTKGTLRLKKCSKKIKGEL